MTTTAEVIFAGLLILSLPDGDEKAVVALPGDAHHHLRFVLLKGEATCDGRTTTAPALLDVSREIAMQPPNKTVVRVVYPETSRPLHWITGAVGRLPSYGEQSEYLSWLPSLSPMVWGDSRLPGDCRELSDECPRSKARFFLDRGKLTTCHFVHDPKGYPKMLKLYKLPSDEVRALGDAFSLREEIDGDVIELEINGQTCTIEDVGKGIQLFVIHEPGKMSKGTHFKRVHQLQSRFYQRMDRSHPKFEEAEPSTNYGSCEKAVKAALKLLAGPQPRFMHSPTECVPPTQP